jgi:STE24 endopeptidase
MDKYFLITLGSYTALMALEYCLEYLNFSRLKRLGSQIPAEFEGQFDQALLTRTRDYAVENTRLRLCSMVIYNAIILAFFFGGFLEVYNRWVVSMGLDFIVSGLVFFAPLACGAAMISIPPDLYRTFKIEKRHGFSTTTPRLWFADFIKSMSISAILMVLIVAVGLWLVQKSPRYWWFWVWGFFSVSSLTIAYLAPYVIEPLFHKFPPVDEKGLGEGIRDLMWKAEIKVGRVFAMDASRRSRHTNAYFTGIGRVKRIVLYDTLIEKLEPREILSVLAHEAGHWKKRHLAKHLLVAEILSLAAIYLSFHLMRTNSLFDIFVTGESSFFTKTVIVVFFGALVSFPLSPLINYFSRKHENEADRFACKLTGDKESVISALVKLSRDNLSNLHPHPLYAAFHYAHPPVLERITLVRKCALHFHYLFNKEYLLTGDDFSVSH